jgi:transposase
MYGLGVPAQEGERLVGKGSGVSRGDGRRNARLAELRRLVPRENAIVGVDLAEVSQAVVVADHDSRVLARRSPRCRAWQLGEVLDWAAGKARERGFGSVTVACEPTGSRWMHVQQACAERGLSFVCVQPLVTHSAREAEDLTGGKSDQKDAVLIARLAAELRCYRPEEIEDDWAVLRCLGQRRDALVTGASRCRQQIADRLALAWPAVLGAAAAPLDSVTFLACLQVAAERCDGDPGSLCRYGAEEFTALARGVLAGWGGKRVCRRVAAAFHAALGDSRGAVPARRRGALMLAGHALADLRRARRELVTVEAEMIAQLEVLGIAGVLATIGGLSLEAAACILAETGDPARFGSSRALVKHAGVAPAGNSSGNYAGRTRISRRGRPLLRKAAWRAAWPMIHGANPVLTARYARLTSRDDSRLAKGQAHVACQAALLRWIYSITTSRTAWDPRIAAGTISHTAAMAA